MRARLVVGTLLLLAFWLTRLTAVGQFPPFIDEAIHIYYSEVAASGSPLAWSEDGRQFTIWLYALFQSSAGAPIFTARAVTVLATMLGFAALTGTAGLLAGQLGALFTGLLLLVSPYHLFFERLALADPLSAALAMLGLYFAARLVRRASLKDAALCGFALFLAGGAKVIALPLFVIVPAAALLLPRRGQSWAQRLRWMAAALAVGLGLTALYVGALAALGHNPFTYVFDGGEARAGGALEALALMLRRVPDSALRVAEELAGYLGGAGLALLVGLMLLARQRLFLLTVLLVSTLLYLMVGRVETRHVITTASLLLLSGGVALADLLRRRSRALSGAALALIAAVGLLVWLPFAAASARDPQRLPLPPADYAQYITSDGSGLGLEELRGALAARAPRQVIALIANCQALRYLSLGTVPVTCPPLNPSGADIPALNDLLQASRAPGVYAVLEDIPYVPASAPGQQLLRLEHTVARPAFTIYDLAP